MRTYTEEELSNPSQELIAFIYSDDEERKNFNNQLDQFLTGCLSNN